ncbi:MAG: hypothetical protein U5J98_07650 [Halobacteriales archaeon]|nr:hypothetical protein [Halobacteriales archaeon]
MGAWACGIAGCGGSFEQPSALIRHQAVNHAASECRVCGEQIAAGYLGIRHTFEEHTRAEYVRAYDADSDAIREREQLLDFIEEHLDVGQLVTQLEAGGEEPVISADD